MNIWTVIEDSKELSLCKSSEIYIHPGFPGGSVVSRGVHLRGAARFCAVSSPPCSLNCFGVRWIEDVGKRVCLEEIKVGRAILTW